MLFIGEEYLLYFCRTVIGVVFAFSSISKVRDLDGFSQSIARFEILLRKSTGYFTSDWEALVRSWVSDATASPERRS